MVWLRSLTVADGIGEYPSCTDCSQIVRVCRGEAKTGGTNTKALNKSSISVRSRTASTSRIRTIIARPASTKHILSPSPRVSSAGHPLSNEAGCHLNTRHMGQAEVHRAQCKRPTRDRSHTWLPCGTGCCSGVDDNRSCNQDQLPRNSSQHANINTHSISKHLRCRIESRQTTPQDREATPIQPDGDGIAEYVLTGDMVAPSLNRLMCRFKLAQIRSKRLVAADAKPKT
jgi:hypothetical protein